MISFPRSRFVMLSRQGCRGFSTAKTNLKAILSDQIQEIKDAGTFKEERVLTSAQAAQVTVSTSSTPVLNFCANNYLGLANDPSLIQAAKDTMDTHGFGLSSVRFICGTQDIHKELEERVARFHGMEDAILYPSCFDANAGLFEALLGPEDAVISDALNHASIIDGIRLCKASRFRYNHMDMEDLEAKLIEAKDSRIKLIATDGVFSMDGDVAPLKEICDLADKYGALVFIDECHATGFFGETGRGTDEYCKVRGRVDIINSTLGKAMGGATGGYTATSSELVTLLRQKARPYLFSNTLAPSVVGASVQLFKRLENNSELVEKVRKNTILFRSRMSEAGFELRGAPEHPIVPIMLGDARLASNFADAMLARGVYVIGFSFPVVPKGLARIRTQISASHSEDNINFAVDAFIQVGKKMGVLKSSKL